MFELKMFQARDGDAVLLSYDGGDRRRHVLVDGGRTETYAILRPALIEIAARGEQIDLLILTHLDADHIGGLLEFVRDPDPPVGIEEVWFNGLDQLTRLQTLGFDQADTYAAAIREAGLESNRRFQGGPIVLPPSGVPPRIEIDGGLAITLLSPDADRLSKLAAQWRTWHAGAAARESAKEAKRTSRLQAMGRHTMPRPIDVAELAATPDKTDRDVPNGSSIAFIAEWGGSRVLIAADAHAELLSASLDHLRGAADSFKVDLLKISHHGSAANTDVSFIRRLDCRRYAISTDGSRHGHPNPETIAKFLCYGTAGRKTFWFNYRQDQTTPWEAQSLRRSWDYDCHLPDDNQFMTLVPVSEALPQNL